MNNTTTPRTNTTDHFDAGICKDQRVRIDCRNIEIGRTKYRNRCDSTAA